ncbi:MAG: hypothetical protein A3J18_02575 [Candidatus Levybacteria bacterium RIFCSPLOWO2_02_FULL_40_18]|nr:MAG: 1-deoxy-d-xylulose-5-phosphate synthase [Candidatus Levybacteria bacterium GW2011_GWA2_36_13]KKQ00985.1 MAG: 1-deoxy-d-xylulose-5-phosphate synthase [Candidatus Levybacteria bacterium GW2011_GWB1_36_18]KKR17646.1 MAG: 1-deoxy-d-xylulose-5-phosphate synthase [Candidatus Levybacteria bacterium GW2011_GWA1_39_32]OGH20437.1 MAG: hypothetical protein A2695_01925 [Candidatus Levybacteria bacterium RIFCSPHIGHO2_01_FULL_40_83]OGH25197.1 MAG: hypothetical protein A3D82_04335 [Candidatus Levybact
MRDSFISSIYKVTKKDKNVLCIVGDIGAFLLRNYIKDFPNNYFNLGVAEANMVGVASGLAMSGKIPFVYTITPFITARPYEQIKVDVCYNNANVKLVGVGSGASYGTMGSTHHSLDDLALMSTLPNMTVISPSDPLEVEEAVFAAAKHVGPVYIRLTLKSKPLIYKREDFKIGKARVVRNGKDVAVIATGDMVEVAVDAASILEKENISCQIINMHTIKPIDERLIGDLSKKYKVIISIEEHSVMGGLGSAISSVLAQIPDNKALFKAMGFRDEFVKIYASDKHEIFNAYGLSEKHLANEVLSLYMYAKSNNTRRH